MHEHLSENVLLKQKDASFFERNIVRQHVRQMTELCGNTWLELNRMENSMIVQRHDFLYAEDTGRQGVSEYLRCRTQLKMMEASAPRCVMQNIRSFDQRTPWVVADL